MTVNTVWTGPGGIITTSAAQPVMGSNITYTSTVTVSSFGREQSGVYRCNAVAESVSTFISDSKQTTGATTITTGIVRHIYLNQGICIIIVCLGVYLSLKGVKYYTNDSIVVITEIGQTDTYQNNALQCITDRKPCCQSPNRFGEWYFPDRTIVPIPNSATTYYRLRGENGTVNLNRLTSDVTHPTGRFCCVVPDATNVIQTLCINISKLSKIIILWYPFTVLLSFVLVPSISVWIGDYGTPPITGKKYSLMCNISGAENLDPIITYRWTKNNGTQAYYVVGKNSNILSFSSLRLSDAGKYFCE